MNVSSTLLYIFFALLQIYIYFIVGMIAHTKKITSSKMISEIIFNFLLPIYATVQLAFMATWNNIEIMWILVITVLIAMATGFIIGKIIYRLFGLDCRMENSFPYLISLPSLGTLPLVLGKALCYPGGMLEGDPQCQNILGFMMMNCLIFYILLFVMGFTLLPRDANLSNSSAEKMSFLWHHLIPKLFDKDYTIYSLFKKYMKDKKTADKMFSVFDKKYKLDVENGEIPKYILKSDPSVILDFNVEHHLAKFDARNSIFKGPDSQIIEIVIKKNEKKSLVQPNLDPSNEFEEYFQGSIIDENSISEDEIIEDEESINQIVQKNEDNEDLEKSEGSKSQRSLEKEDESCAVNYVLENKEIEEIAEIKEKQKQLSHKDLVKLRRESLKRLSFLERTSNETARYYILAFIFIEVYINEDKILLFKEEQERILNHVSEFPSKFPIVKNIELTTENMKIIDDEWDQFEKKIKHTNENFIFKPKHFPVNINTIIVKILSPPILCCFFGLLIGMSGMRDILFSSNHYISNAVSGINLVAKATVPFLYVALGISMLSVKNINYYNTPISTKYVWISFLLRFLILPSLGLLYVYLWKTYFGGIVADSKVFRISMFMPFCLPSAATVVIVVNMLEILKEETSLVLFVQNTTILITMTIWYMIYFVTIGS